MATHSAWSEKPTVACAAGVHKIAAGYKAMMPLAELCDLLPGRRLTIKRHEYHAS